MGEIFGGALAIALFSTLFEWALFKRVMDDPVRGKMASLVAAWVFALLAYGISSGSFAAALIIYTPGLAIVTPYKYWRGQKIRADNLEYADDEGVGEVFE